VSHHACGAGEGQKQCNKKQQKRGAAQPLLNLLVYISPHASTMMARAPSKIKQLGE